MEWIADLEYSIADVTSPFHEGDFSEKILKALNCYKPVVIWLPNKPDLVVLLITVEADDRETVVKIANYLMNQVFDSLKVPRQLVGKIQANTLAELEQAVMFKLITAELRQEGFNPQFPDQGEM